MAAEPAASEHVDVEGQVLSVRVLEAGGYGVMLGPPPDLFYLVTDEPLKVGARARATGRVVGARELPGGVVLTQLDAETVEAAGPATGRFVHAEWLERVDLVCRRPLYDYQREGAAWMASRLARKKGSIIADHMGVGKTVQIIAAMLAAEISPVIIVCPLTLKTQWRAELEYAAMPLEIETLDGAPDYLHQAHVYLVHYDILKLREKQLRALGAKLIVFDEGHLVKEPRPDPKHRAAVATRLAHHVGLAVIATGTPLLNHAEEYWRLLHIVDPKAWPSFEDYAERYCHLPTEDALREDPAAQKRIVTAHGRVERSEELQSRVGEVLIRRTKEETHLELPVKERRVLPVELDPADRDEYERAFADVAAWYRSHGQELRAGRAEKSAEALQKLSILRQITTMAKMRRAVPEYLEAWFGREIVEPLVVFGYHRAPLAALAEYARSKNIKARALLAGEMTGENRAEVVEDFREGKIDLLIAPIRIAGVGLNLQNAARAMFLEWTWVPADMEQAEARIDRIGQTRPPVIDYLVAKRTIDVYMAEVIAGKQVLIDSLVDGTSTHETAIDTRQLDKT